MNLLKRYLPILQWLPNYKKENFSGDLTAGLTVGVILIPQGIAYAMIAGLPPIYGLYTALIPQIIYAIFGTSRQLAIGPAAMDSLIVVAGISTLAKVGEENFILMAITLAFMVGVMQLVFGLFRLGFLVNFLSKPVISGFTSAAVIIIGLNQLKHLFGADIPRSNQIHQLLLNIYDHVPEINMFSLGIGIASIILILALKKIGKRLPTALIVVIIGIVAAYFFNLSDQGVKIVEEIPGGLPSFSMPSLTTELIVDLFPFALTLSLIGFMEAISIAKRIEEKHNDYKIDANQELIAIGLGNIVGSFFKTYPATASFSRTAINDQSGAKTGLSFIIAAVLVALTLLFLTPLFYYLPKSVLAAIIIVAVFGLIDFQYPKKLWSYKKDDFAMLMVTFLITLSVGISYGILTGVLLSLILLIYRSTRPHIAECARIEGTDYFKNIDRFDNANERKDVLIFRFDGQLYFANISYFKDELYEMVGRKGDELKLIVLNAEAINHIDSSAILMLENTIKELRNKGVYFAIAGAIGPVRDLIFTSGLAKVLTKEMMFAEVKNALACIDTDDPQDFERICREIALQTNESL